VGLLDLGLIDGLFISLKAIPVYSIYQAKLHEYRYRYLGNKIVDKAYVALNF